VLRLSVLVGRRAGVDHVAQGNEVGNLAFDVEFRGGLVHGPRLEGDHGDGQHNGDEESNGHAEVFAQHPKVVAQVDVHRLVCSSRVGFHGMAA